MSKRVAFVTGGGGGIGAEICRELAAAGHRVAVADLSGERATEVAESIEGIGIEVDVTRP
jgi:NAD(P)-dependent dehydrogenase (short-subunit alcohol dehydrogenase family)